MNGFISDLFPAFQDVGTIPNLPEVFGLINYLFPTRVFAILITLNVFFNIIGFSVHLVKFIRGFVPTLGG